MDSLTQRERDVLEESFALYDTVGDSKIEIGTLGEALRGLGLNPTQAEVQKLMNELDSTGSTRVSFEEFLPIFQSMKARYKKKNPEYFIECFRVFDREQTGCITAAEFHHVITTLGEALTPQEVALITQGLEDKDGNLQIEKFVRNVMDG